MIFYVCLLDVSSLTDMKTISICDRVWSEVVSRLAGGGGATRHFFLLSIENKMGRSLIGFGCEKNQNKNSLV